MQLKAKIEDLAGKPLKHLHRFAGLEVLEPLNDSLTSKVLISMSDPAVTEVKPLERVLSVTCGPFLIFRGRLTRPIFNFDAGTVQINAHDPTLILKHHYHAFGDYPVDYGYPIDGIGMRALVESSVPKEPDAEGGMFPNGILYGVDETNHQEPQDAPDSVWRRVERGTNVWESITNLAQIVGAPDFWFRPIDNEHQGITGEVPPGYFCEFDVFQRRGDDKSFSVIFEKNTGRKNADNVIWEPDGTSVRNFWVQVYPGGDRSSTDDTRRARVLNGDSINRFGMMMGWESSGQKDPYRTLVEKGRAWVRAYAFPPDFFTVVPKMDGINVPEYRRAYDVGDTITARAKNGYVQKEIEGRIVQARLTQADAQSNTRVELECVPTVASAETIVLGQDN